MLLNTHGAHIPRCNNGWTCWHRWTASWRHSNQQWSPSPWPLRVHRVEYDHRHHDNIHNGCLYCRLWLLSLDLFYIYFLGILMIPAISIWLVFVFEISKSNTWTPALFFFWFPKLPRGSSSPAAEAKDPSTTSTSSPNPRSGRPPSSTIRSKGLMFGLFGDAGRFFLTVLYEFISMIQLKQYLFQHPKNPKHVIFNVFKLSVDVHGPALHSSVSCRWVAKWPAATWMRWSWMISDVVARLDR